MCEYCDFSKGNKIGLNLIESSRGEAVCVQANKLLGIRLMAPDGYCLKEVKINYCPMCGRKLSKDEKMIEPGKLNGYLVAIKEELRKAEGKHPDFCEALLDPESRVSWAESESRIKARNAMAKEYADNVLMEEVAEAFNAYQQGDKAQALHEFAQCGAVILRIMEFVEGES